jgi:hypothetical protein
MSGCHDTNDNVNLRLENLEIKWAHSFEDRKDIRKIIQGLQKQIEDVIGLFVKGDSKLEDDIIKLQLLADGQIENDHKTLAYHVLNLKDACKRIEKLEDKISEKYSHPCVIDRIEKLERQMKASTEMYKSLSINVAGLNDSELKQHDKNKKISARVDEIEGLINAIKEYYNSLCAQSLKKEPYNCPVCGGSGAMELESIEECNKYKQIFKRHDNGKPFIWCASCDGKGIVWG